MSYIYGGAQGWQQMHEADVNAVVARCQVLNSNHMVMADGDMAWCDCTGVYFALQCFPS